MPLLRHTIQLRCFRYGCQRYAMAYYAMAVRHSAIITMLMPR